MFAMCMVYGLQQIRRAMDGSMESLSRSAPKSAYFVRGSFGEREAENESRKINMKNRLTIVARRWCRAFQGSETRDLKLEKRIASAG